MVNVTGTCANDRLQAIKSSTDLIRLRDNVERRRQVDKEIREVKKSIRRSLVFHCLSQEMNIFKTIGRNDSLVNSHI